MNVLIIGLGSIAKKHIQALKEIHADVHFFAFRSSPTPEQVDGVKNIYRMSDCPEVDFVMISNPTALHAEAIEQVIHLKKPLFIEKPPFHNLDHAEDILKDIKEYKINTYTAFNLRFLDSLIYLKKNIDVSKVQEVNVYCGSYLPQWRPGTDYKKSYSAHTAMGGGVHLDLIHELDYVLWIFGKPLEVRKILRSASKINIDAIDYANYALVYENFVVNIILNYFRRDTKRTCEIIFDEESWMLDLIKNNIRNIESDHLIFQSQQAVQHTYKSQMIYFCDCIAKKEQAFSSLAESVETLKIALA